MIRVPGSSLFHAARAASLGALVLPLSLGSFAQTSPLPAASPDAKVQDQPAEAPSKLRYVRAGKDGAKARNLADAGAVAVLDLAPGALLAVHGERAGWLDVEAPGGFKVWVWGEYVTPASEAGMLEITGSDVRMRPLPSGGTESYYLRQTLGRGVKVRYIQRHDPGKPLSQDWVQIFSPPQARAWVAAAETVPLEDGASGPKLWAQAVQEAKKNVALAAIPSSQDSGFVRSAAAGGEEPTAQKVGEALKKADAALARERKKHEQKGIPNYAAARSAYEEVLQLAPGGPTADLAKSKLDLIARLEEAHTTEAELEMERARRQAELKRREEEMALARTRDSLAGRFEARGWLEKRILPGEREPVYQIRFGGESAAEVVCLSGRYDLAVFADHEIGVFGAQLRGPIEGALGVPARARQLDVKRIEILAAR